MLALQPWLLFLMAGELKIALYSLHLPHACATVLSIQVVLRIVHPPHPHQEVVFECDLGSRGTGKVQPRTILRQYDLPEKGSYLKPDINVRCPRLRSKTSMRQNDNPGRRY